MPSVVAPSAPRFEHRTDRGPVLGIASVTPRLSWTVANADPGYVQRAYEVEITRAGRAERHTVESTEQVFVEWPAAPLRSREAASVRVRVRDDAWSDWSEAAVVEAGLLHAAGS
jgi:alpha-L-rhamnosidase